MSKYMEQLKEQVKCSLFVKAPILNVWFGIA